jgi:dihydrolipoamide dehydrogenase
MIAPNADFDLIIIGSGPGGYVCAIRAAQLGMKVALVERRARAGKVRLGGTCLNVGCIPSKALLDSSERFHDAGHTLGAHGIEAGAVRLDLARMMARKDAVVQGLVDGVAYLMKKNKVTVLAGTGTLVGPGTVEVSGEGAAPSTHRATSVVLAMGSAPVELPFLKPDGKVVITSDHAIALERVPKRLVVVGGGVIGLELGSVWSRLGAEVTVVEFLPQILPFLDPDVAQEAQKILAKQGLKFHLATKVTALERGGQTATLKATAKDGAELALEAEVVLVAVGRRPLSDGLERSGIALDDKKRVRIDARFQTNHPGVYAIGDLVPGPMLAHKAEEEGVAVAEILAGQHGEVDYRLIPNVIYTWPEIASVGLTEAEARARGEVRVGRFPVSALGRARASGEIDGSVKIIADAKTDRVLGAAIIAPRASDLLAEITAVMAFGGSSEDIARTCHAHPTYGEGVKEAALVVLGRALHA